MLSVVVVSAVVLLELWCSGYTFCCGGLLVFLSGVVVLSVIKKHSNIYQTLFSMYKI